MNSYNNEYIKSSTIKKKISQYSKLAKDLNKHFFKEYIQIAHEHKRRCSVSLVITEIQFKPQ